LKGTPENGPRRPGAIAPGNEWEVLMAMHSDHHVTDTEDAAFDATMKIAGMVIGLIVIAVVAFWYISS
jgi:hypothetical protein